VLHFFPFTCLPEIIAKMVFTRVSGELDVPILSISIDEQTGRAGMQTRLEALIDLAWSKHRSRGQAPSTSTSTSPRLSVAEV
jgi:predicted nucleotide-binding protein (sugar kinase/HSP70/actin superfamily)